METIFMLNQNEISAAKTLPSAGPVQWRSVFWRLHLHRPGTNLLMKLNFPKIPYYFFNISI